MRYLTIILLLNFVSCTKQDTSSEGKPQSLGAKEYTKYLKSDKSGLVAKQSIGDLEFSAMFKPLEYIVVTERSMANIDATSLENELAEIEGMQYFNFQIKSKKGGVDLLKLNWDGSQEQYLQKGDYLTFAIQKDFTLIDGNDTLNCQMCHFARNYNIAPTLDFVIGFSSTDDTQNKRLIYTDQLFGLGKVHFNIHKEDLDELPELKV